MISTINIHEAYSYWTRTIIGAIKQLRAFELGYHLARNLGEHADKPLDLGYTNRDAPMPSVPVLLVMAGKSPSTIPHQSPTSWYNLFDSDTRADLGIA